MGPYSSERFDILAVTILRDRLTRDGKFLRINHFTRLADATENITGEGKIFYFPGARFFILSVAGGSCAAAGCSGCSDCCLSFVVLSCRVGPFQSAPGH